MRILVLFLAMALSTYAEVNSRASISTNVQFEDLDGKSYDLFELLNDGKYLFVHSTHSG